jgi:DNA-binding response OmpR family regulator
MVWTVNMPREKRKPALPTALIVDDEPQSQSFLIEVCSLAGYKTISMVDGLKALVYLGRYKVDLVLVDFRLPGIDGLIFAERARGICPGCPIVVVSNYAGIRDVEKGYAVNIDDFIVRPIVKEPMVERLLSAVKRRQKLNEYLVDKSDEILTTLNFDTKRRTINWFRKIVVLTPREVQIVRCLTRNPGHYYKLPDIYMALYGLSLSGTEARAKLLPMIKRLRSKLEEGAIPRVIQGKKWSGLCWDNEVLNSVDFSDSNSILGSH